jgi:histidinol-phosphate aminotransferase
MTDYDKPPELYAGLRLHQNENTGGCSPRVLAALAALSAEEIAVYPPYQATVDACAGHLGVPADRIALVNGLDEGILALAITHLKPDPSTGVREAVVPEPAFEIFAFDADVLGARVIRVPPREDFSFALDEVIAALTPATGVVFLTNPNNPTGLPVPADAIRSVARRLRQVSPQSVVLLDEAYGDFAGETFLPHLHEHPNVVVGRTFSKAYGLAGIRIGALVGKPATLDPIRRAIPVYSVNVAAAAALRAALEDRAFVEHYLEQVRASKELVYAACQRLGLKYWPSATNFVLIRVGSGATDLVARAAERGIYLRDRSGEPGCDGCIRFTAGVVDHTRKGLAVLEEVLCAAR